MPAYPTPQLGALNVAAKFDAPAVRVPAKDRQRRCRKKAAYRQNVCRVVNTAAQKGLLCVKR
jgi:hypothetical protein